MDSMNGMAEDTIRSRAEGSEASAFGMHTADAGSDAYDRDFALSLLSKEQDALYEIDEALKRLDSGTYGICEMCSKPIPQARLEVSRQGGRDGSSANGTHILADQLGLLHVAYNEVATVGIFLHLRRRGTRLFVIVLAVDE